MKREPFSPNITAYVLRVTAEEHILCSPVFLTSVLAGTGPQGCNKQEFYLLKECKDN
jgi:hypothetical protein